VKRREKGRGEGERGHVPATSSSRMPMMTRLPSLLPNIWDTGAEDERKCGLGGNTRLDALSGDDEKLCRPQASKGGGARHMQGSR
jgi:hypothetical protein